jgi:hypothetical protein
MELLMGKNMGTSLENMGKTSRNIMAKNGKHIGNHRKICGKLRKHLYTCRF